MEPSPAPLGSGDEIGATTMATSTHAALSDRTRARGLRVAGIGIILLSIGAALLPAFLRPDEADQIFVDHLTIAAVGHTLMHHGVGCRPSPIGQTALAPGQERRAKELLSSRLDGSIFISDLATECGLPTSVFLRAFRQSTGCTPHRWLLEYRVEQAKRLLARTGSVGLGDVARVCGFANQDHLVRVFKRTTGLHPEMWRDR